MAKDLPYFKFIATEWLTGDIVYESLEIQGLFINICAVYWQREGHLTLDDLEKRYKNHKATLDSLLVNFLKVKKGKIEISFLDRQFLERGFTSVKNSSNGKKGGRPKKEVVIEKPKKATALIIKPKETNKEEEREEEKNKKESESTPAPELQFDYMIGDDEILSIHEIFKEKFSIVYNTVCSQYGELKVKNWTDDFSMLHKQKTWKDYQDFRQHISSYFAKRNQTDNDNTKNGFNGHKKGLGSTIPTNQNKPAGKL